MHKVTMTKVTGGSSVRTNETVGHCHKLPAVGESFEMMSESLSFEGGIRWITTSTIQDIITHADHVLIETTNSTYKLKFG